MPLPFRLPNDDNEHGGDTRVFARTWLGSISDLGATSFTTSPAPFPQASFTATLAVGDVLLVSIFNFSATTLPTSVKWGTTNLTMLASEGRLSLWGLLGSTVAGTHEVTVTFAASADVGFAVELLSGLVAPYLDSAATYVGTGNTVEGDIDVSYKTDHVFMLTDVGLDNYFGFPWTVYASIADITLTYSDTAYTHGLDKAGPTTYHVSEPLATPPSAWTMILATFVIEVGTRISGMTTYHYGFDTIPSTMPARQAPEVAQKVWAGKNKYRGVA